MTVANSSFVNGAVTGAGIVLVLMSVGFLQYIAPVENQQGVSSTEIRVAIMLGGIVAAASIAYEYYSRKEEKKQISESDDIEAESHETDTKDELNE